MDGWGILLWIAAMVFVLLPRRWDPAIRLKEYNERKRDEQSRKH